MKHDQLHLIWAATMILCEAYFPALSLIDLLIKVTWRCRADLQLFRAVANFQGNLRHIVG